MLGFCLFDFHFMIFVEIEINFFFNLIYAIEFKFTNMKVYFDCTEIFFEALVVEHLVKLINFKLL